MADSEANEIVDEKATTAIEDADSADEIENNEDSDNSVSENGGNADENDDGDDDNDEIDEEDEDAVKAVERTDMEFAAFIKGTSVIKSDVQNCILCNIWAHNRHREFPQSRCHAQDLCIQSSRMGPYQALTLLRVLSVSLMMAMPSKAPGSSPNALTKSARTSRW